MGNNYIISEEEKPCYICGKKTNRIEYCYETYICSQECEDKMNKKLMESENIND
jgi:hypothetical protein